MFLWVVKGGEHYMFCTEFNSFKNLVSWKQTWQGHMNVCVCVNWTMQFEVSYWHDYLIDIKWDNSVLEASYIKKWL